jgi:hypothetical protein
MRSPFPPSSDRVLRASSDFSRISALRDGIKYRERQSLSARSPTLWPSAALPRAAARQPCPGLDHGETGADHPPCRRLALTRSGAIALFRKFDDQLGDRHCCRIGAIDQPKLTQRGFEGRRQVRDVFGPKRVIVFEKSSNRHVPRPAATCCASEMQLRDSACALGDKSEREPDLSAIRPTSERLYGISVPKPSGVPGGRNAANAAGGATHDRQPHLREHVEIIFVPPARRRAQHRGLRCGRAHGSESKNPAEAGPCHEDEYASELLTGLRSQP